MKQLRSFDAPIHALVVGANGGIGCAFVDALLAIANVEVVHAWSRSHLARDHHKLSSRQIDMDSEDGLREAAQQIDHLSLIIIATGVLHRPDGLAPEKSWKALDASNMIESFRINTLLPAMVLKHTIPKVPRNGKAVISALSARVGSISDNRLGGWYSYRSSKAALNQVIKCVSIELQRTHPDAVCLGLHPGTVYTGLSEPFQASLPTSHALLPRSVAAAKLLKVWCCAAHQCTFPVTDIGFHQL